MTAKPESITRSRWYQLQKPYGPTPEIWDLCIGNGQHLAWDRCWAFVLSHTLGSRELSIVWSIGYAVKSACEERTAELVRAAYDEGWHDACSDHLAQEHDPAHPIGAGRKTDPTALEEIR